ncbi:MAG: FAD-dependent oxidoreductase [Kiritimatiellae bacterium]|nr:FAD-dependent oxidoreductase [Kiritimatiellia bacterium]
MGADRQTASPAISNPFPAPFARRQTGFAPEEIHQVGGVAEAAQFGNWYGVPYRSLVPLKVDNLLVAGRCLSADAEAAGAVRVMPPSMAMGEAAGTAAALCARGGTAPRNLDPAMLATSLKAQGAFLR